MLLNHSDPSKIADALMMDEFYASFKDAVSFFFFQSIILEGENQKGTQNKKKYEKPS